MNILLPRSTTSAGIAAGVWLCLAIGCGGKSAPATASAAAPAPSSAPAARLVRATGTIQPVKFSTIQVPQITGQGGRLTLTRLISNGVRVKAGDVVAEFDRTVQLDNARDTKARYEGLGHQVEQRRAQNVADAAKRTSDLRKAEADLAKAKIDISKGVALSEIEQLKNAERVKDATAHVESLKKSNQFRDQADAAALRILELQRDRQKVSLDRALNDATKMEIRAPLDGMVSHENVWRNNSMGHPQEGDQLWGGQPLLRIFDPAEMEVRATIAEADDAVLTPGCSAEVRLDAYPDLVFHARLKTASPAASSALGSPIKTFSARFRLEQSDPHLLPDLSAALTLERPAPAQGAK